MSTYHIKNIASLIGAFGIVANVLIYQPKTGKNLLIYKPISNIFWALHYLLLGGYSGFIVILLSCKETGEKDTRQSIIMEEKEYPFETKAQLCVTNDTLAEINGIVHWALRNNMGSIIKEGYEEISVPPFPSFCLRKWTSKRPLRY